jgi:hypothetical protein
VRGAAGCVVMTQIGGIYRAVADTLSGARRNAEVLVFAVT